MRTDRLLIIILAAACFAAAGCWYQRPNTEGKYKKIELGMTKEDVVKKLGDPTVILEGEMFYIYDDPKNPVRFRFVLNDQETVVAKYYESKKDLAKKTEQTKGEESTAVTPPAPAQAESKYPGGPLPRFEKKGPPW
jgi:outer membrane protein assembly factor BamE (lipoprotein component of BamABCDE complex)